VISNARTKKSCGAVEGKVKAADLKGAGACCQYLRAQRKW